jgi:hypothetical protein
MEAAFKPDLLNLPWATLLALASGYAGYFVANVGIRDHHKPIDVIFSTLVFGFIATFAYNICRVLFEISLVWSSVFAFSFALLAGAAWSLIGRSSLEKLLRKSRVSHSDDLPSAWIALFGTRLVATQLSVKLKDGSWLMCDDLSKFSASPNGPCVLGAKGDVLMYVTHKMSDIGVAYFPTTLPIDDWWGHEITYVPADQIARIDLRRKA